VFCLAPPPLDDLVDALFRDTEGFSNTGSGFTCFIPCDDFRVAVSFFRCVVCLWHLREWGIVEHLHDVKSSQPNVEASCGVEAPVGHYGARLASPLETMDKPCFSFSVLLPTRRFNPYQDPNANQRTAFHQSAPIDCTQLTTTTFPALWFCIRGNSSIRLIFAQYGIFSRLRFAGLQLFSSVD
jgi:hypothetical protein